MEHTIVHLGNSYGYEDTTDNQDTLKHRHDLRLFSYASIMEATNGFSSMNKLGEGGFGPVYKVRSIEKDFDGLTVISNENNKFLIFTLGDTAAKGSSGQETLKRFTTRSSRIQNGVEACI